MKNQSNMPLSTKKSSNASERKTRKKALANKMTTIQDCINFANEPDTLEQNLKKIIPSFNEVAAGIPSLAGPPESCTDEQIEAHREAMKQREDEIAKERAEAVAERGLITYVFRQIARQPGSGEAFKLPPVPGQWEKVVLDAQNRVRVEPVYPALARLWQDFREALQDLDASRVRECPLQNCSKLFWAKRSDQSTCGRVCANRLRVQRFNKNEKKRQTRAWNLRKKGNEISEIADRLKVTKSKARQYLRDARREASKGA